MPELGFTDLILGFLLLITPVVYFHELGHYWVARKAGVVVDVFSIGFGPEIYGWTAKTGTRWRISAIPLGGYVKMRGDDDAASTPSADGNINYEGITLSLSGIATDGDSFSVVTNTDGVGDNRNMLLLARLQTKDVMPGGGSINDGYADIVTTVGSQATLAKMSKEALQVIYDQSLEAKDRISGVSLDEEAADLIKFQQAFQASAKIIQVSQTLFDSILAVR